MANITNAGVNAVLDTFNAAYPDTWFTDLTLTTDVENPQLTDTDDFVIATATPTDVDITFLELGVDVTAQRIILYAEALALAAAVAAGDYGPLTVVTTEANAPADLDIKMDYTTLNDGDVSISYNEMIDDDTRNDLVDIAEGYITNAQVTALLTAYNAAYPDGWFTDFTKTTDVQDPNIANDADFVIATATPTNVNITYLELADDLVVKRISLYAEALALAAAVAAGDYGPLVVVTAEADAPIYFDGRMEYLALNSKTVHLSYNDMKIDAVRNLIVDQAQGYSVKVETIGAQLTALVVLFDAMTSPHSYADYVSLVDSIREIYEAENF
jgi:hypothetical protein